MPLALNVVGRHLQVLAQVGAGEVAPSHHPTLLSSSVHPWGAEGLSPPPQGQVLCDALCLSSTLWLPTHSWHICSGHCTQCHGLWGRVRAPEASLLDTGALVSLHGAGGHGKAS